MIEYMDVYSASFNHRNANENHNEISLYSYWHGYYQEEKLKSVGNRKH